MRNLFYNAAAAFLIGVQTIASGCFTTTIKDHEYDKRPFAIATLPEGFKGDDMVKKGISQIAGIESGQLELKRHLDTYVAIAKPGKVYERDESALEKVCIETDIDKKDGVITPREFQRRYDIMIIDAGYGVLGDKSNVDTQWPTVPGYNFLPEVAEPLAVISGLLRGDIKATINKEGIAQVAYSGNFHPNQVDMVTLREVYARADLLDEKDKKITRIGVEKTLRGVMEKLGLETRFPSAKGIDSSPEAARLLAEVASLYGGDPIVFVKGVPEVANFSISSFSMEDLTLAHKNADKDGDGIASDQESVDLYRLEFARLDLLFPPHSGDVKTTARGRYLIVTAAAIEEGFIEGWRITGDGEKIPIFSNGFNPRELDYGKMLVRYETADKDEDGNLTDTEALLFREEKFLIKQAELRERRKAKEEFEKKSK